MKITSKGLVVAGALVVGLAVYIGWLAITEITDSRYMTTLCGTTMSNVGIAQASSSLVVAGVLALAGVGMLVQAWKLRRRRLLANTEESDYEPAT